MRPTSAAAIQVWYSQCLPPNIYFLRSDSRVHFKLCAAVREQRVGIAGGVMAGTIENHIAGLTNGYALTSGTQGREEPVAVFRHYWVEPEMMAKSRDDDIFTQGYGTWNNGVVGPNKQALQVVRALPRFHRGYGSRGEVQIRVRCRSSLVCPASGRGSSS